MNMLLIKVQLKSSSAEKSQAWCQFTPCAWQHGSKAALIALPGVMQERPQPRSKASRHGRAQHQDMRHLWGEGQGQLKGDRGVTRDTQLPPPVSADLARPHGRVCVFVERSWAPNMYF